MNTAPNLLRHWTRLLCLLVLLGLAAPNLRAAETDAAPTAAPAEAVLDLQASLKLQEQLHATKLALERNRQESESLSNAVANRLKLLEEAVQAKQDSEAAAMQAKMDTLRKDLENNNRLLLLVGGGIAAVGFFVLLATAYLQWRSVNRLAEFSAVVQAARAALPAPGPAEAQLLGAGTTVQANTRLFGAITQLERRIMELEHTAHPAIPTTSKTETGTNGFVAGAPGETNEPTGPKDAVLLAKGQALMDQDKPTEALVCFEEILRTEPHHGEALVKKGLALEALERAEEALACYDLAITTNPDLTIAYLQKGGLFNRLERYEEALKCYEQALHAQEKAHQG